MEPERVREGATEREREMKSQRERDIERVPKRDPKGDIDSSPTLAHCEQLSVHCSVMGSI